MPRDVEATKRRLRDAALEEFTEHGLHGTTVERIAARARANKERLYSYFGDKNALFTSVLVEELDKVAAAVPVRITRTEDYAEMAGRTFDYLRENPGLPRLLLWESLADTGQVADEAVRRVHYRDKAEAIGQAQRDGLLDDTIPAHHLMFLLLSVANWWFAAPQVARMLTAGPIDEDEWVARRASVVEAARQLAEPKLRLSDDDVGNRSNRKGG
ncbi:TetR family transcriptional regulator [Cryptosporangium phraense]|uniref:TetR/AcrR family transcriptional regulator n=1 Tax=Cryptosporangium phraense TaxID=2593070 RepID=A0A545AT60_9ACTN|nr:TetR family transcriptional regulator [Cryptosporangium phraense]TQS44524.1 TetR/AcrR family transcriptional regulator [Cryptosporangium phraense]